MDWDLALLLWGNSVSSDSTSPTLTILLGRRRDTLLLPGRCGIPCSPTGLCWHCRKGSTVIIFVRIESPGSLLILFWHHTHWKAGRLGCLVRAWQGWKSRLPTWLVEFVEWVGLQFFLCVFVWSIRSNKESRELTTVSFLGSWALLLLCLLLSKVFKGFLCLFYIWCPGFLVVFRRGIRKSVYFIFMGAGFPFILFFY